LLEATDLSHHFTIRNQAVVIVDDTLHGKGNVRNIRLLSLFLFLVHLVGCAVVFRILVSARISVALAPSVPCHWMNGAWVFWAYTMFVLELGCHAGVWHWCASTSSSPQLSHALLRIGIGFPNHNLTLLVPLPAKLHFSHQ
jgi:hypothetical protein